MVHDISPANGENIDDPDPVFHLPGLFWLVRLTDDQWEEVDENTWHLSLKDLYEVDRFQLMGPGNVKMHLNLETTYTRTPGSPIVITPLSADPTSPRSWAGRVWEGSASSTFSATTDDGAWSVSGTMDYAHSQEGATGHIMHERNGVFLGNGQH
jgi:hypothetical protein